MASPISISDDDDSFEQPTASKNTETYLSDDSSTLPYNSPDSNKTETYISSDEDYELPSISIEKKKNIVKKLFPGVNKGLNDNKTNKTVITQLELQSHVTKMIEGILVTLPVNPYGSQIALMSKVSKYILVCSEIIL